MLYCSTHIESDQFDHWKVNRLSSRDTGRSAGRYSTLHSVLYDSLTLWVLICGQPVCYIGAHRLF